MPVDTESRHTDPAEWLAAHQSDLISDGNCGCIMTLDQCKERQRSRKNHEVADDDQSAIAREFVICAGDKKDPETRCRHFDGNTSEKIPRCRLTKHGIKRERASQARREAAIRTKQDRKKKVISNPGQAAVVSKNPEVFAWRMSGWAGSWKLT